MDFNSKYEISRTSDFIQSRNFTRVALQFPDELLKDSMKVVYHIREDLKSRGLENVKLFIMADTAYGSCCIDEVGASHVDADCVIHYGHTCLSPTSILPALCIFGKSFIDVNACVESLSNCMAECAKPIIVLYGLEYTHAIPRIREIMADKLSESQESTQFHYADTMHSILDPFTCGKTCNGSSTSCDNFSSSEDNLKEFDVKNCDIKQIESKEEIPTMSSSIYTLGGLKWNLPKGHKVGDYLLFWIGDDNPAFTNAVLTFNFCEIVRYDTEKNVSKTDFSHHKKILKRRYFLVEKAKDSNIIGILVGTLGVAGYLSMIHQMKDLIKKAGKKSYTLVMGRPNPAKLANFPECDLFIYVSCAQTALLDSKEFLAPVITPFEAMLAFNRGSQWTGAYVMEFQELMTSTLNAYEIKEAARFSFLEGGYVEDLDPLEKQIEEKEQVLVLAETMEKSLQAIDNYIDVRGKPRSGAEFFTTRSFRGLDIPPEKLAPLPYVTGRTGRAAGYDDEKAKVEEMNAQNAEIIN